MATANARARRRGKDHERRLAAATGGKRNGNTGRATADVEAVWLCIEAKSWTNPPRRVEAALEQAERAACADQLPIAVIHTMGRRSSSDLVVMRWGLFADYFGGARRSEFIDRLQEDAAAGDAEAALALRMLAPDQAIMGE